MSEPKAAAKKSTAPAAKRTTRRKAPGALTPEGYASADDPGKKAILVELRDTQGLAWWKVSEALNLGGVSKSTGKHFGQPARTQYTKYVRPHTESNPHGLRGRPRKDAKATPAPQAPAKKTAAKKTSATRKAASGSKRTASTSAPEPKAEAS